MLHTCSNQQKKPSLLGLSFYFHWFLRLATCITCALFMPTFEVPVRITMNSSYARIRGKQLTDPVPPESHRHMTNVDATLGQQTLDLAQR